MAAAANYIWPLLHNVVTVAAAAIGAAAAVQRGLPSTNTFTFAATTVPEPPAPVSGCSSPAASGVPQRASHSAGRAVSRLFARFTSFNVNATVSEG